MYTRRNFIKIAVRNSAFAGIAIGSGYLIFKEQSEEVCNLDFICQNCKRRKECKLPEAEEHKNKKQ